MRPVHGNFLLKCTQGPRSLFGDCVHDAQIGLRAAKSPLRNLVRDSESHKKPAGEKRRALIVRSQQPTALGSQGHVLVTGTK